MTTSRVERAPLPDLSHLPASCVRLLEFAGSPQANSHSRSPIYPGKQTCTLSLQTTRCRRPNRSAIVWKPCYTCLLLTNSNSMFCVHSSALTGSQLQCPKLRKTCKVIASIRLLPGISVHSWIDFDDLLKTDTEDSSDITVFIIKGPKELSVLGKYKHAWITTGTLIWASWPCVCLYVQSGGKPVLELVQRCSDLVRAMWRPIVSGSDAVHQVDPSCHWNNAGAYAMPASPICRSILSEVTCSLSRCLSTPPAKHYPGASKTF